MARIDDIYALLPDNTSKEISPADHRLTADITFAEIDAQTAAQQTDIDGKEPIITPKADAFNDAYGTIAGTICQGNDTRLSDTRDPNAHNQAISTITGLQTELDGKKDTFSENSAFNKAFGSTAGTVCQGNDSRLSDDRDPTAHTHSISDTTGLQTALDGKSATGHGHVISDTTGLQTEIDTKEDDLGNPGTDDYVLASKTDGTRSWIQNGAGGGVTELDGLSDVTITTPANTEILKYNGSQWVNATDSGGGAADLDDLSDVTITTPSNQQALFHNGSGQFVNRAVVKADISDFTESDYATGAEGDLAVSATQPADNISTLTNNSNFIDSAGAPVQSVATKTGAVTLVKADITDFDGADYATAAQGATADLAVPTDVTGITGAVACANQVHMTETAYGLITPDTNTVYLLYT